MIMLRKAGSTGFVFGFSSGCSSSLSSSSSHSPSEVTVMLLKGTGFRLKNGFFVPSFASGLMTAALMVSLAVSAKLLFFSCGGSR